MKSKILTLIVVVAFFIISPQAKSQTAPIDSLCDNLFHSSNKYIENEIVYRVVRWQNMNAFFEEIKMLDTEKSNKIDISAQKIKDLEGELTTQKEAYEKLNAKYEHEVEVNDAMEFMTLLIPKKKYNFIMWSLIVILIAVLVVFYLMYKRSHQVTQDAEAELKDKIDEFESYRKRALKREQEVSSSYMREINKLKEKLSM